MDQYLDKIITNSKDVYDSVNKQLIEANKKLDLDLKKGNILELYNINKQLEELENRKVWLNVGDLLQ